MTSTSIALAPAIETAASATPARSRARVVFVDVLRLLALLQMVNGHTLDAVMVDAVRSGPIFDRYVYLRGLVSVAFMLASGLAVHLTTFARFDAHRADRAARRARVRRALLLVAIGYGLHLNSGLLSDDPATVARCVAALARIDVLHTIGFSLLALEGIVAIARTAAQARALAIALGAILLLLAPLGSLVPIGPVSQLWVGWVGHQGGSLFPITPWAAYVLFGAGLGGVLVPQGDGPARAPLRLAIAAAVTLVLSWAAGLVPLPAGVSHASEPGFVLEKLAVVLFLVAGIALATRRLSALPGWLATLAGETLVVYVLHFVLLFWTRWGPARVFPHVLSLPQALLVSLAMVLACIALGLLAPRARALAAQIGAR